MLLRPRLFGKTGVAAVALIFAAIGAHTLKPRELFHEMYPLEPVKQDAFHICDEADPTFVRAVGAEREACYNKMPHVMAVAMGRVKPGGALSMEALTDPSREAEPVLPAVAYTTPSALPSPPGSGRAAALDSAVRGNLPPLRPAPAAS